MLWFLYRDDSEEEDGEELLKTQSALSMEEDLEEFIMANIQYTLKKTWDHAYFCGHSLVWTLKFMHVVDAATVPYKTLQDNRDRKWQQLLFLWRLSPSLNHNNASCRRTSYIDALTAASEEPPQCSPNTSNENPDDPNRAEIMLSSTMLTYSTAYFSFSIMYFTEIYHLHKCSTFQYPWWTNHYTVRYTLYLTSVLGMTMDKWITCIQSHPLLQNWTVYKDKSLVWRQWLVQDMQPSYQRLPLPCSWPFLNSSILYMALDCTDTMRVQNLPLSKVTLVCSFNYHHNLRGGLLMPM